MSTSLHPFVIACALPAVLLAESKPVGGPLSGPAVLDAAFSATATTTIRQTLADGTRIDRTTTARYYRHADGRARIEQRLPGSDTSGAAPGLRVTIWPAVTTGRVYTLDPTTRTASAGPLSGADWAVGGGETFAVPLGGPEFLVFHRPQYRSARGGLPPQTAEREEALGTRSIEGVDTVGRRIIVTIPSSQIGGAPIAIVEERWESAALKLLILSHLWDARRGTIDYWLHDIQRDEPPADLFVIPPDYSVSTPRESIWIHLRFADNRAQSRK